MNRYIRVRNSFEYKILIDTLYKDGYTWSDIKMSYKSVKDFFKSDVFFVRLDMTKYILLSYRLPNSDFKSDYQLFDVIDFVKIYLDPDTIKDGSTIEHFKFGRGTVLKKDNDSTALVKFDDNSTKRLILKHAKLKVIQI